jgi:hypothetical protein
MTPATQRQRQDDLKFQVGLGKVSQILSGKQNTNTIAGSVVQVIRCFPGMHKTTIPWV